MLEETAESDSSKVAPETLLQSLSVMVNFLEILQELHELFVKLISHADTFLMGYDIFLLIIISTSQEFLRVNCLSPGKLVVTEAVDCQNLFLSFLSFAFSTALLCNYCLTL